MQKQIENLNRHVFNTTKNQESLEQVETTLLLKLDKKEAENYQLKKLMESLKVELELKTEGCLKAQKIIQRLSEKSDSDDSLIQRLNSDANFLRRETQEKAQAQRDLQN